MPRRTHVYGIDTSVFVRLLTGHPEKDYRRTVSGLKRLYREEPSTELVVSNQVIGEAYVTLQYHYGIGKRDAREAILQILDTGMVAPMNGQAVRDELLDLGGAGLVDRLIVEDYRSRGHRVLTNDKRMARLDSVTLLGGRR